MIKKVVQILDEVINKFRKGKRDYHNLFFYLYQKIKKEGWQEIDKSVYEYRNHNEEIIILFKKGETVIKINYLYRNKEDIIEYRLYKLVRYKNIRNN